MFSRYQASNRVPLVACALLVLTLLQASSFNLSLAFRGPLASNVLVTFITLLWLAMYAFSTLGLFVSSGINWITWLVRYRLLLTCLLIGTALSIVWSIDTALSIERVVHLIGTTLVAFYLGFSLPLQKILRVSGLVLGFIMMTSVLTALFVPSLGLEEYQGTMVWTGTLASKNTLGFWAATTVLLCASLSFWSIPTNQRLMYGVITAISLLCLYKSASATSVLSMICAGAVMLYLHAAFSLRLGMLATVLLGILVLGIIGVAFYFIDTAELIGRSGDLTGRGEVWSQTWNLILDRPFTGYGYGTLWYPTPDSLWIQQSLTDFSWTVYHAHNGLLQVASEIGLPLTVLAVLMIVQQLVELVFCQYRRQQPGVLFVLGFVVALVLSNYSEARLLANRELYWVFLIALPLSMLQQVQLVAPQQQHPTAHTDADRRHLTRTRKEQKLSLKSRMRKPNRLRVINPKAADIEKTPNGDDADIPTNTTRATQPKSAFHKKKPRR